MMILSKYGRQWLAWPVSVVVERLHRLGISPNAVSYTGFALTLLTAVLLAGGYFIAGGILLTVASLLDLVDGSLARATKQSSTFGAFLDSTLDRYSESVTLIALAYHYAGQAQSRLYVMLILLTVVGSLMVSYTRARAEALNVECKEGWLQRPERVFLLIVALLFNGLFAGWLMLAVLAFMAVMTNATAIQRIYQVYRRVQQQERARALAGSQEPPPAQG
jgi:CDP-diacylglycerol--glycerol-3-phosphate 3-phosphatidyltransferase